MRHTLSKFSFDSHCMFLNSLRFIDKDTALSLREHLLNCDSVVVKISDVTLKIYHRVEFKELLVKFFRLLFYPVSFFRLKFSAKRLIYLFGIFVYSVHSFSELLLIKNDLGCGIDIDGFKLFKRPLRHDIKASDRLDLIAPKFYSVRVILSQVKNVNNISSY